MFLNPLFKQMLEVPERTLHGPHGAIGKRADGAPLDFFGNGE